jgi:hypothetical protein
MESELISNPSGGEKKAGRASRFAFLLDGTAVVVVAIGIAIVWSSSVNEYRAGLRNTPVAFPWVMAWGCTLCVALPAVILGYLVWVVVTWRRSGRWRRVARVVLGLSMTLGAVSYTASGDTGMDHYVRGFEDWSRSHVNVPAIQTWAGLLQLPPNTDVPPSSWPPEVQRLQPEYVRTLAHGSVDLWWGGGFGHWGLTIDQPGQTTTQPSGHATGRVCSWNRDVKVWTQ